jgi:hypothetical protein
VRGSRGFERRSDRDDLGTVVAACTGTEPCSGLRPYSANPGVLGTYPSVARPFMANQDHRMGGVGIVGEHERIWLSQWNRVAEPDPP